MRSSKVSACLFAMTVKGESLFMSQTSNMTQDWGKESELKCQGYSPGIENNKLFQALTSENDEMPVDIQNMTFYRSDWYSYCYNYYDGQYYDYYD